MSEELTEFEDEFDTWTRLDAAITNLRLALHEDFPDFPIEETKR